MSQRFEQCFCISSSGTLDQLQWEMFAFDNIDFPILSLLSEKICLDYDKKNKAVIPLP